jgi:hypothetical protein
MALSSLSIATLAPPKNDNSPGTDYTANLRGCIPSIRSIALVGPACRLVVGTGTIAAADREGEVAREAVEQALALEPGRPVAARLQKRLSGPPTVKGAGRLCEGGDLEACVILGGWLIDGNGTSPDPLRGVALIARAAALYEDGCLGGGGEACTGLGLLYVAPDGLPADPQRARELLGRGCELGHPLGCSSLEMLQAEAPAAEPRPWPPSRKVISHTDPGGATV